MMVAAILCSLALGTEPVRPPRNVVPFARTYGNHRVRLRVIIAADVTYARIPWARRDDHPEAKDVVVTDADGNQIANRVALSVTDEEGWIAFQPSKGAGVYYVYYMPYTQSGWQYMPTITYNKPRDTADPAWKVGVGYVGSVGAAATVEALESRTEFDAFGPMEQPASEQETAELLRKTGSYGVFPEDRLHPIVMSDRLPARWKDGPAHSVEGKAKRGEFFAFQLGVWAAYRDLSGLSVHFSPIKSRAAEIPASAFRCINTGGTDWLGRPFTKKVDVQQGHVQALWCGLEVPTNAKPGVYIGKVRVKAQDAPEIDVPVRIQVIAATAKNHGDDDLKSMARLRRLDSKIGLDDEVVAPFTPLKVKGNRVECLQRQVTFGLTGLPESIVSNGRPVLAEAMKFIVRQGQIQLEWKPVKVRTLEKAPAALEREIVSTSGPLTMTCRYKMEADGYIGYRITLAASADTNMADVALEIPYDPEAATYMTGLGRKGGFRPNDWHWKWDVNLANNMVWLGSPDAGMQCKLKTAGDTWDLYNLRAVGLPESWDNHGKGGADVVSVFRAGMDAGPVEVVARAFSGPRVLKAGQDLEFKFAILITPVKPLNPAHWTQRYEHVSDWNGTPAQMVDQAMKDGATVINIHQGNMLNPYINYPFVTAGELAKYAAEAHKHGIKAKIYYTVRELSNRVAEMSALRSLGHEVFVDGPGGGDSWLQEHLGSHYTPAWHSPLADGSVDAAIATVGLSRWHNYYLEGLSWLIKNVGIDGLYLDGIGYDREIMKRVRKVMDRARPGCLIDFHSGNNFDKAYGLNSCVSGYMEHFPYVDSLWFGEMFNYDESPDYWLVEISGIPFGLYGEMLQNNGNPWRGMIYGMTARYYSGADPKHIWKLWDDFGIAQAKMLGYWSPACPVHTDNPDVLATAYVRKGRTLISLASWSKEPVSVQLRIDWKALGLDPAKVRLVAPAVQGFQGAASFSIDDPIPVEPGKGWLLIASEAPSR